MTMPAQPRGGGPTTAPTSGIAWRFLLPTLAAIAGSLLAALPWLVWTLERDQITTLVSRLQGEAREAGAILPWSSGAALDRAWRPETQQVLGDRVNRHGDAEDATLAVPVLAQGGLGAHHPLLRVHRGPDLARPPLTAARPAIRVRPAGRPCAPRS